MGKSFTFKDAKALGTFYRNILSVLYSAKTRLSSKATLIKNKFENLKQNNYFSSVANLELDKQKYRYVSKYFDNLLLLIYKYIKTKPLVAQCNELYDDYIEEISGRLKNLSIAEKPVFWLFASKKKKSLATAEIEYLTNYKQSYFADRGKYYSKALQDIEDLDVNFAKESYYKDPSLFKDVIENIDSNAFSDSKYLEKIDTIFKKHNDIQKDANSLKGYLQSKKEAIKKAIESLTVLEVIKTLRDIPIEEIGRNRKGIRTNVLRNAGYNSVSDIYTADVYTLSSLRGISYDLALTIKRAASEIGKETQKGIKIKLSLDDKNKSSNLVVREIHNYRLIRQSIDEVNKVIEKYQSTINGTVKMLDRVGNGSVWPFLSEGEKNDIINSYCEYKNALRLYGEAVRKSLTICRRTDGPNIDESWDDFAQNSIQFYNIIESICPGVLGTSDSVYGLPEDLAREIEEECIFPDGLLCTLRRYQEWGVKYILHQEKVLLGDEMGLGKTVQAIATMVSLKNTGATHFLVICPASVITNWCREISKHSKLRPIKVHGYEKRYALRSWIRNGGVAVTTYESTVCFNLPVDFKIDQIVVDEAHFIKNPEANRSIRTKKLCEISKRILFMTGTALENNVDEMISLISILSPNLVNRIRRIAFMPSAPRFRQEIAPVYYRRKREDVLTELPDLIENEEWCEMSPEEERAYESAILGKNYMESRRVSWNIEDISKSSKAKRLLEIIEDAKNDNRKILVFSFFLDTIYKIQRLLGYDVCLNPINGSVNPKRRQEIIDEFDSAPAGTVLCAQIQSGGTGLNIQAASVVVICEPQLKPSIENQAISRAYRMGQSRNVQVFRLLCQDTIDERMMDLLKEKQEIFNAFADKSVAAEKTVEIDDKTFGDLINAEIERIKNKNANIKQEFSTKGDEFEAEEQLTESPLVTYKDELNMSYDELVSHLLSKYGKVNGDYFLTESCKSVNKAIKRGNEGFFVHHIDENKAILLSNPTWAARNPFEYQKAHRLCYCNILEHLILHLKIASEPRDKNVNENELVGIGGAAAFICRQINDCFSDKNLNQYYMLVIREQIRNSFEDYISILQKLYDLIKSDENYSLLYTKEDLCCDYDGSVVHKVYEALK